MDSLQLLIDLHKDALRQGPGSDDATRLALRLAGVDSEHPIKIADIGCGTGATTLLLAKELAAEVTAVDFLPEFLEVLEKRAKVFGVEKSIKTVAASMDALPFAEQEFDVIWSEGAIYNMGFEAGINYLGKFLRQGGVIAVSEITWLTNNRPFELHEHWVKEYPEIDTASAKLAILEKSGFTPIGYFILSPECWLENYYIPMEQRFKQFLLMHKHSDDAQAIVASEQAEIALYKKYQPYYSYGFYIATKK